MKVITKTVYNFSELSESAKENATHHYNENLLDSDDVTEQLEQDLFAVGTEDYEYCFPGAKISWSLSYCQGDGVSFTGQWQGKNLESIVKKAYSNAVPLKVLRVLPYLTLTLQRISNRYSHPYTVECCIDSDRNYSDRMWKLMLEVQSKIDSYRLSVCKKLENYGYSEIEYQSSEEHLSDFFNANDYYFDEYGNIER